jgi:zinc transport system ATP-binding protein
VNPVEPAAAAGRVGTILNVSAAASPTAVLAASGVCFAYGRTPVLDHVSFELERGEFVALAGPNGSGKSTLMRVLLGVLPPTRGTVEVLGSPPARLEQRWRIGYVPQRPVIAPQLPATVEEVVAAGRLARRGWWRRFGPADRAAVDDALDTVALTDLRRRRLGELSGGQQQRAFIAKALASEPELLVLDEPTTGVDQASQRRFRDALVHLARDRRAAVLLVSHELGAVADDLDRILLLRRGSVAFDGKPADLAASGVSLGVHATDLPLWLEGLDD